MRAVIDHIVCGCEQLEKGTAYLERVIGEDFVVGGKHDLMKTHNKLMRLQDSIYLESIAIDRDAAEARGNAGRKRWFSLDDPHTRQKLAIAPYPLTWVVAVDNIVEAAARCGYDPGRVTRMTRGDLAWSLTVSDDGGLAEQGLLPCFIEWPDGRNPAGCLPQSGITLHRIILRHPDPGCIAKIIDDINIDGRIDVELGQTDLIFEFHTCAGKRISLTRSAQQIVKN